MNPIWIAIKELLALIREIFGRAVEAKKEAKADDKAKADEKDARRNDGWSNGDPGGMFNG
jgi:hypothetical protein